MEHRGFLRLFSLSPQASIPSHVLFTTFFLFNAHSITCAESCGPSVYKRCNMEKFAAKNVKIDGLVGFFPQELAWLIKYLKMANHDLQAGTKTVPSFWRTSNRILIHGPYGNGQHTIARTIAEQTNSVLLEHSIEEKTGIRDSEEEHQELAKICDLFAKAKKHIIEHNQTVVIFIENIHFIGEDFWRNPKAPIVALWLELDGIVNNPNIVVIASSKTNYFLAEPFIDRMGSGVMQLTNPNKEMQLELIKIFWEKFLTNTPYDEFLLKTVTDLSSGLSIRDMEEIFQSVANTNSNGETSSINVELLCQQAEAIQDRNTLATLKEIGDKIKKYGPKTLQAIVLIVAAIYGAKFIKNIPKKATPSNQSLS